MRGLSLVAASGDHSSSRCTSLSLSRPLLLRSTGSRRAGSVIVAHGPSCSVACGIFPDQGSNPCPLQWQADSQPLRHQGSPRFVCLFVCLFYSELTSPNHYVYNYNFHYAMQHEKENALLERLSIVLKRNRNFSTKTPKAITLVDFR